MIFAEPHDALCEQKELAKINFREERLSEPIECPLYPRQSAHVRLSRPNVGERCLNNRIATASGRNERQNCCQHNGSLVAALRALTDLIGASFLEKKQALIGRARAECFFSRKAGRGWSRKISLSCRMALATPLLRLAYERLAHFPGDRPTGPDQVARYDDGVGTSSIQAPCNSWWRLRMGPQA